MDIRCKVERCIHNQKGSCKADGVVTLIDDYHGIWSCSEIDYGLPKMTVDRIRPADDNPPEPIIDEPLFSDVVPEYTKEQLGYAAGGINMDWDLEVKRLIFDELDGVYANAEFPFVVEAEIIDNKLIMSVSHADLNESKDFEVILKEINVD